MTAPYDKTTAFGVLMWGGIDHVKVGEAMIERANEMIKSLSAGDAEALAGAPASSGANLKSYSAAVLNGTGANQGVKGVDGYMALLDLGPSAV